MSGLGFILTKLRLTGQSVQDAEVTFTKGLNVIYGPSDTGKTFIVECINFMLGGKTPVKSIDEARPYEFIHLHIRGYNSQQEFILTRSIQGGDFELHENNKKQILSAVHSADRQDNISQFLLNLLGVTNKKIRTNKDGNTQSLSFRNIIKLNLITETEVVREYSPIFSRRGPSETSESNVFKFLLTGTDDSSVIVKENPKLVKSKQEGKSEAIRAMIAKCKQQLTEIGLGSNLPQLEQDLLQFDRVFEFASSEASFEKQAFNKIEKKRKLLLSEFRKTESELGFSIELQKRFKILKQQYLTDIKRLGTIIISSSQLEQMSQESCPICGSKSEYHEKSHEEKNTNIQEVIEASQAEISKTKALLRELESTLIAHAEKIKKIEVEKSSRESDFNQVDFEVSALLRPKLNKVLNKVKTYQQTRDQHIRAIELCHRMNELDQMLVATLQIQKTETKKQTSIVDVDINSETEKFSKEVEKRLKSWQFPNLDRVTFDAKKQDVLLSGKLRANHGKGVRAITHAAFTLALMKFCIEQNKAHPGFVLIDSPLIVYKPPRSSNSSTSDKIESEKEIFDNNNVKDSFYMDIFNEFKEYQVIIIENTEPPIEIQKNINFIEFTGSDVGRHGFIPNNNVSKGEH